MRDLGVFVDVVVRIGVVLVLLVVLELGLELELVLELEPLGLKEFIAEPEVLLPKPLPLFRDEEVAVPLLVEKATVGLEVVVPEPAGVDAEVLPGVHLPEDADP